MIHFKISLAHQISKPPNEDLSKDENKALKELQSDTSIAILGLSGKMYGSYKQWLISS